MKQNTAKPYSGCKSAFLFALLGAAAIFLPFVIFDSGFFIYYGDFNVQQIPFYRLAHQAVRSGEIFWNWKTDLGANFIGSYSFYLLFSPFFWLTLPFPGSFVPHLMAPLLVLKTACASAAAFAYLRRFVRDERYAVIGGLFYAFSGWMTFNIFFNHFHEAAVFFPLLLLSLEKLVAGESRWGSFALMVLVNSAVNYWFFIGEVVFVIIYVIVRTACRSWAMTWEKFLRIAVEALLGVGMAAFVLLPSVLALMGNPRTGTDDLLSGWNFWRYWDDQKLYAIIHSFFFPPELPARPNYFPGVGSKWSSMSAWLPMLGPVGVMAYFGMKKNDWLKTLLGVSIFMALVPGLNSLFILLNHSYYARWFYMPILLAALASVRVVEDGAESMPRLRVMMKWHLLIAVVFALMAGITPNKVDDKWKFGLGEYPELVWGWFGIVVACIAVSAALLLNRRGRQHPRFIFRFGAGVLATAVCFTVFFMALGKNTYERSRYMIDTAIGGRDKITLPEGPWARSDIYDATDNMLMHWDLPNIQAFHSIVPASIMEFYPAVGVKRDVSSKPEAAYYALRPLLSVRWLFIEQDKKEQAPMPRYTKYGEMAGYNVYENENFLPMGFAYDHYILPSDQERVSASKLSNLLLRAVLLNDEAAERNADILTVLPEERLSDLGKGEMDWDVEDRRRYVAEDFRPDRLGFTARTDFDADKLLFFSVPWDAGWSASVNGSPVRIEKANIGFMAVRVPAGECAIRFDYMTPGLITGLLVSGASVLLWAAYVVLLRRRLAAGAKELEEQQRMLRAHDIHLSWDEFLARYGAEERREALQRALNEAAARHMETALPEEERTLHFTLPDAPPPDGDELPPQQPIPIRPQEAAEEQRPEGGDAEESE